MNTVTPSCRLHFYFTPLTPNAKRSRLQGRRHKVRYPEPYLSRVTPGEFQSNRPVCVGQLHLPQGTEKIMGTIAHVWCLKTVQEYTNPGLRTYCVEIKVAVQFGATNQHLFNQQTDMFLDCFEYLPIVAYLTS